MRWCLTALFMVAGCLAATQASAERRVALVVGNSQYEHTPALANPRNDAEDLARTLEKVGFEVKVGYDLDQIRFARLIDEFARALEGADVGLFFYAGHGLQISDKNYLVSTQAKLESTFLVASETIDLDAVIRLMESKTGTNLVFLDACRNNPLTDNLKRNLAATNRAASVGRGLAPIARTGHDTLVVYSAAPGEVAADGTGRNSPFAASLLRHLPEPGLEVSVMLKDVTADVRQDTGNVQRPQQLSDMSRKFYFVKAESPLAATPLAVTPPPAAPPAPAAPTSDPIELAFWQSASVANECESIRAYIRRYPSGSFADLAVIAERRLCKPGPETAVVPPNPASPAPIATPAVAPAATPAGPNADAAAPRGWLGVRIQQVTDDIAESLNIKPARGALVAGVDEKGPSKLAGIEAGDVIIRFDGKDIKEIKELPPIVTATPPGKEVEVVIIRKGKEESRTVRLGRLEADEKQAALPATNTAPPATKDAAPPESKEAAPPEKPLEEFFLEFFGGKIVSKLGLSLAPARGGGVDVTAVNPNGTAKDQFHTGDVIISIDFTTVNSLDDVKKALESAQNAGKRGVLMLVKSTNGSHFVFVSIVDAPASPPASAGDQPAPHVEPSPPPARHPATGRQSGGKGRR